jgi:hypothetical protein
MLHFENYYCFEDMRLMFIANSNHMAKYTFIKNREERGPYWYAAGKVFVYIDSGMDIIRYIQMLYSAYYLVICLTSVSVWGYNPLLYHLS